MTPVVFLPALPELFLAVASLGLLLIGVLAASERTGKGIPLLGVLALVVTWVLVVEAPAGRAEAFYGMFVTDGFAVFTQSLVLLAAMATLLAGLRFNAWQGIDRFELPVLVLLSVTGMLAMITANDLISFYIGLELQSLPLYVLAAFKRESARSTEAGLKYFVLSALSSGLLLFGASLLYGFSAGTSYAAIGHALSQPDAMTAAGAVIGLVFLLAGVAFKLSAAPFHMWAPDVYEGSPTSVTAFFAVAPKVAALAVFARLVFGPLSGLSGAWHDVAWLLSVASLMIGGFAAINQTNLKRMMAYSSISHVGFALMGLAAGTEEGLRGTLVYLGVYTFMNLGTFIVLLGLGRDGEIAENLSDLAGLSKTRPGAALALTIFFFSLAGLPPTAGVFAKMFVLLPALHAGLPGLAVLGVVMSAVACFYYLRVVKVMYFEEPGLALDANVPSGTQRGMFALVACVVLFLCVVPGPFLSIAGAAAHTLFP
jgi:NADH-quinone oxidoreductase subunit N